MGEGCCRGENSSKPQPRCDSQHEVTSGGCCADGRSCDEICVELAAAYICKQEHDHVTVQPRLSTLIDGKNKTDGGCHVPNSQDQGCSEDENGGCDNDSCCGASIAASSSVGAQSCADDACCDAGSSSPKIGADDCCGDNAIETVPIASCQDKCCDDDQASVKSKKSCQDSCCGNEDSDNSDDEDACCKAGRCAESDKGSKSSDTTNKTGCYTDSCKADVAAKATFDDQKGSTCIASCCQQKETPEITVTELSERLADLEASGGACSKHLEAAYARFTAFLETGLCICREVLAKGEVCCDAQKRSEAAKARTLRNEKGLTKGKGSAADGNQGDKTSTCGQRTTGKSCCATKQDHAVAARATGTAACSAYRNDKAQPVAHTDEIIPTTTFTPRALNADPENQPVHEHVVFSISGMTCTGCVKKVVGVFEHIPGVDGINVNFVAARADCNIDTRIISAEQALVQLEHETGFKCSRILSSVLALDVQMTKDDAIILETAAVEGIESLERIKKGVYRIQFDPLLIGARTVLARSNGRLAPPTEGNAVAEGQRKMVIKLGYFVAAAVMTIPVVVLTWGNPPISESVKLVVCICLGTLVQLVAIPEFYIPALKALVFSKSIEMDMLVVISITAAYGYSIVASGLTFAGYRLEEGPLFETSTLLITLVILGRLVSAYAKVKAVSAVSLKSLQADTAFLQMDKDPESSGVMELDARLLEYNDILRIVPHSRIVTDGEVIRGSTSVDESMLTGESAPVPKTIGDSVVAGTMNGAGPLTIRVTRLPGQNSISDIANLVSDALAAKPHIQDLADTIAGYFVPVVMAISVVVFVIWLFVALKVRLENAGGAIGLSITYSIAVLAISCPCALGLAVPLVLVVAGGVAAKAGVIIKTADTTERSHKVTDVVFDKTGTLTLGDLRVIQQDIIALSMPHDDVLSLAYSLVQDNEHPVSRAVAEHLRTQKVVSRPLEHVESIPGAGIKAKWNGKVVKAGNPDWLNVSTHPALANRHGHTLLCVTLAEELVGVFVIGANVRPEASAVVQNLQNRGIRCHVVSGDRTDAVNTLAQTLGFHHENVAAQKRPDEKLEYIRALQTSSSGQKAKVMFVGDGTNDAAAIAQADIGLQIGDTSDISRAVSDVVLLGGLDGIITLLEVSKASFRRIMFNFVWSAVYNFFAILLASGAFVKFRVPPAYAGLGEIVSVLPVVVVALSLMNVRFRGSA